MENNQELTVSTAIGVLIQGVEIAQKQGAYTLEDAELLSRAVKFFRTVKKKDEASEAPVEEAQTGPEQKPTRGRKTTTK